MNKNNNNNNEIDTNKQTENQSKKTQSYYCFAQCEIFFLVYFFFLPKTNFRFSLILSLSLCVLDSEREYFRLKKLFTTTNIEQKQIKPTHTE